MSIQGESQQYEFIRGVESFYLQSPFIQPN